MIVLFFRRFQKKPISPSRSVACSSSVTTTSNVTTNSPTTRNVVTSSPNERKRTAPETTMKDLPPSKRVSTPTSHHHSSRRPATSSVHVSTNSSSPSSRNKNWEKQADELIGKNAQQNNASSTTSVAPQPVLPASARPRFTPQPITPPSLSPPPTARASRPRQLPSVVIKRPLVPVTAPSQTSVKPKERISSNTTEHNVPLSSKTTSEHQTSNEEDESQLLELHDSADVVDTFALIDEALLEADHLLELM